MSNKKVWCWRSGPWWRGGLHAGGGFDKHGGRFGPCYFVSSLDLRRGLIPSFTSAARSLRANAAAFLFVANLH